MDDPTVFVFLAQWLSVAVAEIPEVGPFFLCFLREMFQCGRCFIFLLLLLLLLLFFLFSKLFGYKM